MRGLQRKQEIVLLTGSSITLSELINQLKGIFGNSIHFSGYALDEEEPPLKLSGDLILLSSIYLVDQARPYLDPSIPYIVARRIANYHHIDQLLTLPKGTEVLFVNDVPETVQDSIESLIQLGIDHVRYVPLHSGNYSHIEIAVTPGEVSYVPTSIKQIINIGPRLLDITTITEIFARLNLSLEDNKHISELYMKKIIQLGRDMAEANQQSTNLNRYLNQVLNSVNEGIIAADHSGHITVFNGNLEHLSRLSAQQAIGRPLRQVISFPELVRFFEAADDEETKLFHIHGQDMLVTRFKLNAGFVATFKNTKDVTNAEQKLQREWKNKGYIARYLFDDVIGNSEALRSTISIANKLARTDLAVLIEGESGTGKEMFASAIHNESHRCKGPFLAINFSALPEDLVESELFGYEEGAFTGAKKGGRPGLFEQANGGTIFLDEIGDISLKLQARLLRVLQEKEIMRIGGNKINRIDVRVVAATNKNLLKMIDEGKFRLDLYHRLKVVSIRVPALRKRKEDIPLLAHCFIEQNSIRKVTISQALINRLMEFPWYGNIRELKNTIEYMLAVCEGDELQLSDLPEDHYFEHQPMDDLPMMMQQSRLGEMDTMNHDALHIELLKAVNKLRRAGQSSGRKSLSVYLHDKGYRLTEQQIRKQLDLLEAQGYIAKEIGRSGSSLTNLGKQLIQEMY